MNLFTRSDTILNDSGFVPIGLICLGNQLIRNGYTTEIIDTQQIHEHKIQEFIKAKIVGLNYNFFTTELLEKTAAIAKDRGATVIVGGQAATPCAVQLLKGNSHIDYVIKYAGEESLLRLVEFIYEGNGDIKEIPNLVYRDNNKIVINREKQIDDAVFAPPSRLLPGLDMKWYIHNFYAFGYPELNETKYRVTNTFSHKGCPRRNSDSGCSFCARIDKQVQMRSPIQVYSEYRYLQKEYGINYIFDDSDSWIRPGFLRGLLDCYHEYGDLGIKLRVYGDIRDIRPSTIEYMKQLHVESILIGIESGSERILERNHKPMKKEEILRALTILAENDIKVCASYILGLIDEDEETLNETLQIAKEIEEFGNLQTNYWNMITPLPGSSIWHEMMQIPYLSEKYMDEYKFNVDELRSDYINHFCRLGNDGYGYLNSVLENVLTEMDAPDGVREYMR
ncbi:B12-binding domain-containing radical SAM protein [Candidatus Neomarinimicrobiota bacterium]